MNRKTTFEIVLCGLFAALTAVMSQLSLPVGPVPINLATLSVLLAGGILGAKYGTVSQAVFVLLGVFGLPVFAGLKGGAGVLAGPTGGYLLGYIAAAWVVGLFSRKSGPAVRAGSMALGTAVCYILGTAWFMFSTKTALLAALSLCVFPFLIGDAAKIAAAAFLVPKLRRAVSGMQPEIKS